MPTYEYECTKCGKVFEEFHSITAKALTVIPCNCAKCKNRATVVRRIGTGSGIIFKGSGFYLTDYRSDNYKNAAKAEKEKASSSDSGSGDAAPAKTSGKDKGKTGTSTSGSEKEKTVTEPAPQPPRPRCPTCRRTLDAGDTQSKAYRPFCSQRCQLIDLGKWFNEEYVISSPPPDLADQTPEEDPTE